MIRGFARCGSLFVFCFCFLGYSIYAYARSEAHSVFVRGSSKKRVVLLPNRGASSVEILQHTLEKLAPKEIEKMPGFTSFEDLRVSIFTYDLREPKVILAVEKLLQRGAQFLLVVDSGTVLPTEMPTASEKAKWTTEQNNYFLKNYDKDKDGKVSSSDLAAHNAEKLLGIETFKLAQSLKRKFKGRVELLTSLPEIVPLEGTRFPRLQHEKALIFQSRLKGSTWKAPFYARIGSSNFTDAGMDSKGRILASKENVEAFLRGEDVPRARNSQGHIQMNVELKVLSGDETWINSVLSPMWSLAAAFRVGKHFNDLPPLSHRLPKIIFDDNTIVQMFFSEGASTTLRKTQDPIREIVLQYLSNPAMKLQRVFETQFVFTHHWKSRFLRSKIAAALAASTLEDFFIAVDGGFSAQEESAMADLLFAERVSLQETLPGRGIISSEKYPDGFDFRKSAFSYQGAPWRIDQPRHADKLHTKFAYYKYEDDHGATKHVVVVGSGNSSTNAGRGNADMFLVIESLDDSFEEVVDSFKDYLIKEDKRLIPFDQLWLMKGLAQIFDGEKIQTLVEKKPEWFEGVSDLLSSQEPSLRYSQFLNVLRTLDPVGAYGKNLLAIMTWYGRYPTLVKRFSWAEFDLMRKMADPQFKKTHAFLIDISYRWGKMYFPLKDVKSRMDSRLDSLAQVGKDIGVAEHGLPVAVPKEKSRITRVDRIVAENLDRHCQYFLNEVQDGWHPMEVLRRYGFQP